MPKDKKIKIYTDGGSRGNPGPSALGVVIGAPLDKDYSEYLGKKTNNEAEYEAVVFALKKLKSLIGKKETKELNVEVYMDSKLAVNQLNYKFKIESENIIPLFIKIHNLRLEYGSVHFTHVLREKNKDADKLVNIELDKHTGRDNLFSL